MKGWWRHLRLLPEAPPWLEIAAGGGAFVLLLWSRFALLASGPWEWDETLFARGLMWFQLAAHFPHPPGFPGWMAIGHLMKPLVSEPLRGLQLASAALSVATLWPLATLGRRAAPPAVALAGALLVLLAPGPWLHAVRGFSSTPAAFFMAVAAVAVSAPEERLRPTLATLLVSAAFLVRPQLLPALAVLWLALAVRVRSARRLAPGVVLSLGAGVLSLVLMARAEGGWDAMMAAFADHAGRHFSRLVGNSCALPDLGLAKSFGGLGGLAAVSVLAVAGLVSWGRRRGRREALVAALVVLALVWEVVMLQNRTYTRYTVPAALALGPLAAAGAAAVAPAAVAVAGLLGLTLTQAAIAYPPVVEQHAAKLPGWAAVETGARLARRHGLDVVVEAGLHPFASYRWLVMGGGQQPERPALLLSPWAPEPWPGVKRHWVVVTDRPGRYLGSLTGEEIRFSGVSTELEPLTQQRFLEAAVLVDPPLPEGTWWPVETDSHGHRFMWASADAALVLPPLPQGTWLRLDLLPARGPAPLEVLVDGRVVSVLDGMGGRKQVWVPPRALGQPGPPRVEFRRDAVYPPLHGDHRPLAVRLDGVGVVGPRVPWAGPVARPADRERLRVVLEGGWSPERFPGLGWGVWVRPRAVLVLPAGEGTLHLTLLAPRPGSPRTVIRCAGRVLAGPLDVPNRPVRVDVSIPGWAVRGDGVVLEIGSEPFVPALEGAGSDSRELGVVISAVSFEPARRWPLAGPTPPGGRWDPGAPGD